MALWTRHAHLQDLWLRYLIGRFVLNPGKPAAHTPRNGAFAQSSFSSWNNSIRCVLDVRGTVCGHTGRYIGPHCHAVRCLPKRTDEGKRYLREHLPSNCPKFQGNQVLSTYFIRSKRPKKNRELVQHDAVAIRYMQLIAAAPVKAAVRARGWAASLPRMSSLVLLISQSVLVPNAAPSLEAGGLACAVRLLSRAIRLPQTASCAHPPVCPEVA